MSFANTLSLGNSSIRNGRGYKRFSSLVASAALLCGLAGAPLSQASAAGLDMVGVNLAGAEFTSGALPGKEGTNFFFPTEANFQSWTSKGVKLIRFPILWERLQPKLGGDFDPTYAAFIDKTFDYAEKYNAKLILDVHNYQRYRDVVIGTGNVSYANYRDLIRRIALRWSPERSLYAYDIMNEPHDADAQWPIAAQHGIDAIREIDRVKPIMIEGNSWAGATQWPSYNKALLNLKDPADNLIFQAHLYFDGSDGGSYKKFDVTTVKADYGVERVKPFVKWLQDNGKKGFIGEFGVPGDDPRWFPIMEGMLAYLKDHCIPATYWAAGRAWGNYRLSIEPKGGVDRPQWPILKKYLTNSSCSAIGPKSMKPATTTPPATNTTTKPTTPTPTTPATTPAKPATPAPTTPTTPAPTTPSTGSNAGTGSSANSGSNTGNTGTSKAVESSINNFTDSNWNKGIAKKMSGFTIPKTSASAAAFKVGASVKMANGQVYKIGSVYSVGNNMSVYLNGPILDGAAVGHPKKVTLFTAAPK